MSVDDGLGQNLKCYLAQLPTGLAEDGEAAFGESFIPNGEEGVVLEFHGAGVAKIT